MPEKNSNRPNGTSFRETEKMAEVLKKHENNNPRTDDQWLNDKINVSKIDQDKDRKDGRKGGSWNWAG